MNTHLNWSVIGTTNIYLYGALYITSLTFYIFATTPLISPYWPVWFNLRGAVRGRSPAARIVPALTQSSFILLSRRAIWALLFLKIRKLMNTSLFWRVELVCWVNWITVQNHLGHGIKWSFVWKKRGGGKADRHIYIYKEKREGWGEKQPATIV